MTGLLSIEHVAPSALKPAPYNPRKMAAEERKRLERGIKEFGLVDPIIARRSDGLVIGGHQRLASAKTLQLGTVPVVYLDDISDARAAALNVLLNNPSAQGEWDFPKLTSILSELDAHGFDATLTGFDETDLVNMLVPPGGILDGVDLEDAPPLPSVATTRLGDVIILGRHRLLCGDSTVPGEWECLLGERRAGMLWTDPPYGVRYVGKTRDSLTIQNDGAAGLEQLLHDALSLAWAFSRPGAAWYVAAPHGPQFLAFAKVLTDLNVWRQTLVWVKHTFALGRSDYHYRHEAILEGEREVDEHHPLAEKVVENTPVISGWREGAAHTWTGGRKQDTVLEFPKPTANRLHPTMKPVALIQRCIENSSNPSDLVVDPFGGSGSTLLAAEASGRSSALIELSPAYCDVIVTRWENATGQKAVRPS